jgi:hypothetical protein
MEGFVSFATRCFATGFLGLGFAFGAFFTRFGFGGAGLGGAAGAGFGASAAPGASGVVTEMVVFSDS